MTSFFIKTYQKILDQKGVGALLDRTFFRTFAYEVQNKITGANGKGDKLGNPHGFKEGIALIPATAKNMKQLKAILVKWDAGDKKYEKDSMNFKCFEESSGCFELKKEFAKNGGTSYDHPSLRKLISLEEYNNSAPLDYEVENIVNFRPAPPGEEDEYEVKFKGFRIKIWLKESACEECPEEIEAFWKIRTR